MQVIYEESILDRISKVTSAAEVSGRKVSKILLSTAEMNEFCTELGGQSSEKFDYRVVPFKGFLVVESMLK